MVYHLLTFQKCCLGKVFFPIFFIPPKRNDLLYHCSFGYKTFLKAIQGQTQLLAKIVEQNPPTSRLTLGRAVSRLSTSSTESAGDIDHGTSIAGGSEGEQTLTEHEDEDADDAGAAAKQEDGYECSIS